MKPERQRLQGAITALITPFRQGEVDYPAFGDLFWAALGYLVSRSSPAPAGIGPADEQPASSPV